MNERFVFDGRCYKTVALKSGENHCEKCAFNECRECEYSSVIPYCDADKRNDGKNVYFVETKTNFDRITSGQKILAEQLVYHYYDEFNGDEWFGVTGDGIRESFKTREKAVIATLEWLGKEVDK